MENVWEPQSGLWGLSWGPAWNDDTTDWATGLISCIKISTEKKKEPEKKHTVSGELAGFCAHLFVFLV